MSALQAVLGHKQIAMTIQTYGNLQAPEMENVSPFEF